MGLTESGWALYGSTIRESNLVESDLMRGLTARQVDDLAYLLEKLLAGLDSSPTSQVVEPGPDERSPTAPATDGVDQADQTESEATRGHAEPPAIAGGRNLS